MQVQLVNIKDLKSNTGQVEGLPKNPRLIKDEKFKKLKKSIEDDPEMLNLREVIAYDNKGELVVICGNMRLKACKELGIKEVPTKILPTETSIEKLKAYTIKDNVGFGEHDWDLLANEWEVEQLEEWGLDMPVKKDLNEQDLFDIEIPFYTPSEILPEVNELANLYKTKKLIDKINLLEIDNELKEILKIRASFFTDFNFQKIADYYDKQNQEIKELFKDLGMVILAPKEALEKGFIELSDYLIEE
jgi:hypothetical protein